MPRILVLGVIVFALFSCQRKVESPTLANKEAISQFISEKAAEMDVAYKQHPDSTQLRIIRDFLLQQQKTVEAK